mgnify:CR=1 FL=1
MGKISDLKLAENTRDEIGGKIINLNYEICLDSYSSTHCDGEKRKKYENDAKDSMKSKKEEIELRVSNITNSINHALSSSTWLGEIDSLSRIQTKYDNKLSKDVVNEARKNAISNRITKFYNKKYESIKDVSYYLNIVYWIFFTIILMIMFWKKKFEDVRYWPMIIMMILFPLIFMKSIIFQLPIVNKQVKIPSLFDYIFENFDHYKIDNIYITSIILMSILIGVYTLASKWPFKNMVDSVE